MNTQAPLETVLKNHKVRAWFWAIVLGCLPLALYAFTLHLPFYCDDFFLYAELSGNSYNDQSRGPSLYRLIDGDVFQRHPQLVPWWTSPDTKISFFRPLPSLSLMGDYLLWKNDPFGYRLTNLLMHSLSCVFVFLIGRRLFRRDSVAVLAALLFCNHPWVLLVVFWVAERPSLLSLLFGLVGLYCHIRYRERDFRIWEALAWLCFLLSLLSRESGAICMATYFLYDFFLGKRGAAAGGSRVFRLTRYYAFVFGIPLLIFLVYYRISGYGSVGSYSVFDGAEPFFGKIAFLLKNVLLYLYALLFFVPVFSDTNLFLFKRLLFFIPFLILTALFLVFSYPGIKRRLWQRPMNLFLASWMLVSLLPILHLLTQNRYVYLTAVPFGLFMSDYLFRIKQEKLFGRFSPFLFGGAISFLVLLPILGANLGRGTLAKSYGFQARIVQETRSCLKEAQTPVNVFFVNLPNPLLTFALQHAFDFYGQKGQVRTFVLTIGPDMPEVDVLGKQTLLIRSSSGPFLASEGERFLMTDYEKAGREGFSRANAFFRATTEEVENGLITAIRFDFASPISGESMKFFVVRNREVYPLSFPQEIEAFPFRLDLKSPPPRNAPGAVPEGGDPSREEIGAGGAKRHGNPGTG